jgi:hypothetical protein
MESHKPQLALSNPNRRNNAERRPDVYLSLGGEITLRATGITIVISGGIIQGAAGAMNGLTKGAVNAPALLNFAGVDFCETRDREC